MRNINVPVAQGLVDMTSGFRTKNRPNHHGADFFPVPRGRKLPVLAFDGGIVTLTQRGHRTSGNWLEILQDDGLTFTYKHFDSIGVANGQRVARGQQIGVMGNTGNGSGVHLHLESRRERQNNGGRNAFDPMPLILARMNGTEAVMNMNIAQRPSPNHTAGRQGHAPDIIVSHITNGNFPGSIEWVANPASNVSYHFMVSRKGEITQCVAMENTAWANGTTNSNDSRDNRHSLLPIVRDRRVNANLYTVSVGYEGVHGQTQGRLTIEQQEAAVWLIGHIRDEIRRIWGAVIPFTRGHIVGHADITPLTRPDCPGRGFPFDEIIASLNNGVLANAPLASPAAMPGQQQTVQQETATPASTPVNSVTALVDPAPVPANGLRVRVGKHGDRAEADRERDRLRASGHGDAWTVQDGDAWQAQVISGPNLAAVEELAWALREQGFEDVMIV